MKKLCLLLLITGCLNCYAQDKQGDGLRHALNIAKTDSARYTAADSLCSYYLETNRDSGLHYAEQRLVVAKRNGQWFEEAMALIAKAHELIYLNQYPEALLCLQQAFKMADDPENRGKRTWHTTNKLPYWKQRGEVLADSHFGMGELLQSTGDNAQAIVQYKAFGRYAESAGNKFEIGVSNINLASIAAATGKGDSAILLAKKAAVNFKQSGKINMLGYTYVVLGYNYFYQKHDLKRALEYFHLAADADLKAGNLASLTGDYDAIITYYLSLKQADSSLYYAKKDQQLLHSARNGIGNAYNELYKSYELKHQTDSAYKYQGFALAAKDSSDAVTTKNLVDFQKLSFKNQLRLQALEKEREQTQTRIRTYALSSAIGVFMMLAIIFWRNNRQKQKANYLLSEQKEEMATQRDNLRQALDELKNTQTQLVQREKMASLGELTAGIAHEIQNPLNFVNNFSEVNAELLQELKAESEKPKAERDEQLEIELINDLIQNEEKISHHGKRADSIVKGMLEHSRSHSGQKEPTDLNAMADEFMRLSYHGLRAKDKSFNSELITHFDPQLPKVNVSQQDMGRVMLNLFNNAFYAVNQKKKAAGADYQPEVSLTTSTQNGQVVIKVKDNGIGIPDAIKDKIMQPFFTTKPTGEGTGLGLSLTYDMVVKGHGGSIQVNSIEDEGSEFIILLPIKIT